MSIVAACGTHQEPGAEPSTGSAPASAAATADAPAELRALGYGGWDEASAPSPQARTGVTVYDPTRASALPRIWADDRHTIHRIAPDGTDLGSIDVPGRTQVEYARVLEGGRLICVSVDEGVTLLEPDGTVVWHHDTNAHHDVAVVPAVDGTSDVGSRRFAVPVYVERSYQGRSVRFDQIRFLDESTGEIAVDSAQFAWSKPLDTWELRAELMACTGRAHALDTQASSTPRNGAVFDYFHVNTVAFDGQGRMILCLRNVDLIAILDPAGAVLDHVGPGELDWPHAPSMVQVSGAPRLLVFDNGNHRGTSRVVEFSLQDGALDPTPAWQWPAHEPETLFSEVRGFAQRLPGGTTLITESERGRVLEVTRDGAIVWSFQNPEVRRPKGPQGGVLRRRIYRMSAADFAR